MYNPRGHVEEERDPIFGFQVERQSLDPRVWESVNQVVFPSANHNLCKAATFRGKPEHSPQDSCGIFPFQILIPVHNRQVYTVGVLSAEL